MIDTPRHAVQLLQNRDITIQGGTETIKQWFRDFDYQKFAQEFEQKYPRDSSTFRLTGYPFLLYLIEKLFAENIHNKTILEVGGWSMYGRNNLAYLLDRGALSLGIDARYGDMLEEKDKKWWSFTKWKWQDLVEEYGEGVWDCIYTHRIGPLNTGLEEITHRALRPGGYYIGFRKIWSISDNPVRRDSKVFKNYTDTSFTLSFPEEVFMEDVGYEVTLLQKPKNIHTTTSTASSMVASILSH